jgi:hypothetical protein
MCGVYPARLNKWERNRRGVHRYLQPPVMKIDSQLTIIVLYSFEKSIEFVLKITILLNKRDFLSNYRH